MVALCRLWAPRAATVSSRLRSDSVKRARSRLGAITSTRWSTPTSASARGAAAPRALRWSTRGAPPRGRCGAVGEVVDFVHLLGRDETNPAAGEPARDVARDGVEQLGLVAGAGEAVGELLDCRAKLGLGGEQGPPRQPPQQHEHGGEEATRGHDGAERIHRRGAHVAKREPAQQGHHGPDGGAGYVQPAARDHRAGREDVVPHQGPADGQGHDKNHQRQKQVNDGEGAHLTGEKTRRGDRGCEDEAPQHGAKLDAVVGCSAAVSCEHGDTQGQQGQDHQAVYQQSPMEGVDAQT